LGDDTVELFCLVTPSLEDATFPEVITCLEGVAVLAPSVVEPLFVVPQLPLETVSLHFEVVPAVFLLLSAAVASAETDVLFEAEAVDLELLFSEVDVKALKQLIAAVIMRAIILRCMMFLSLKNSVLVFHTVIESVTKM
jgi:hypothetical protein